MKHMIKHMVKILSCMENIHCSTDTHIPLSILRYFIAQILYASPLGYCFLTKNNNAGWAAKLFLIITLNN